MVAVGTVGVGRTNLAALQLTQLALTSRRVQEIVIGLIAVGTVADARTNLTAWDLAELALASR